MADGNGADNAQPTTPTPAPTPPAGTTPASNQPGSPVSAALPKPPAAAAAAAPVTTNQSPQPKVLSPVSQPGLKGVLDEVGRWMAGTQGTRVYHDQDGNRYVGHTDPYSGKQAWARVGAAALRGAVAGFGAGRGAGNQGKAALAGFEAQQTASQEAAQKQETEEDKNYAAQRQAKLDKANDMINQATLAKLGLEKTRLERENTDSLVKGMEDYQSHLKALGAEQIPGIYQSDNIEQLQKVRPDIWKAHNQASIYPVHEVDQNGKPIGVSFMYLAPDLKAQPVAPDRTLTKWVQGGPDPKGEKWIDGHKETYKPSDPSMTEGTALGLDTKELADEDGENKRKENWTNAKFAAPKAAATIAAEKAKTAESNAAAALDTAKAAKERGGDAEAHASYGESVAQGKLTLDQIPPADRGATEQYLNQHHPNLDLKSVMLTAREHEKQQLANVGQENLDQIQAVLNRRPDIIGRISGRVKKAQELVGPTDADYGTLNTALDAYGQAAVGVHGSRNYANKQDAIDDLLKGFTANKAYTDAAIQTMRKSFDQFTGKPRGVDGSPYVYRTQVPPGTPTTGAAAGGAPPPPPGSGFSPSGWQKAHPGGDVNAAIAEAKRRNLTILQ